MFDLSATFGEVKYHEFGIRNISYSLDESDPVVTIEVRHYFQREIVKLTFKGVFYHAVMSESFIYMNDEDQWEADIFIAKARKSELIQWVASYTLLGAGHIVELDKLSHYRVYAQDHFIDLVCSEKPAMALVGGT